MGFWERAVFRDLSVFAAWIGGGGGETHGFQENRGVISPN